MCRRLLALPDYWSRGVEERNGGNGASGTGAIAPSMGTRRRSKAPAAVPNKGDPMTAEERMVKTIDKAQEVQGGLTREQVFAKYPPGYHKVGMIEWHRIGLALRDGMSPGGIQARTGLSRRAQLQAARRGKIHYFVAKGYVLVSEAEVEAYLRRRQNTGPKKRGVDKVDTLG